MSESLLFRKPVLRAPAGRPGILWLFIPSFRIDPYPRDTVRSAALIPITHISKAGRIRPVDPSNVAALAASIREVGLLNPITVYRRAIDAGDQDAAPYGLVAGAHRLAACRTLGHVEIQAQIVDLDELRRIIAECDENLCRPHLSPSEVALLTARRKAAYVTLHPATAHGKASPGKVEKIATFAENTAHMTGASARKVRMDAERGEKIDEDVLTLLVGTKLDKGAYLNKLKNIAPAEQRNAVILDLTAALLPNSKSKSTKRGEPQDTGLRDAQVSTNLMSAWEKADAPARTAFLQQIAVDGQPASLAKNILRRFSMLIPSFFGNWRG